MDPLYYFRVSSNHNTATLSFRRIPPTFIATTWDTQATPSLSQKPWLERRAFPTIRHITFTTGRVDPSKSGGHIDLPAHERHRHGPWPDICSYRPHDFTCLGAGECKPEQQLQHGFRGSIRGTYWRQVNCRTCRARWKGVPALYRQVTTRADSPAIE